MRMAKQAMSDGVSVKIDAVLEGCRPVDALVVWREAELYGRWFPMISKGEMLVERHPTEIVGHLVVETYFLLADLVCVCVWQRSLGLSGQSPPSHVPPRLRLRLLLRWSPSPDLPQP